MHFYRIAVQWLSCFFVLDLDNSSKKHENYSKIMYNLLHNMHIYNIGLLAFEKPMSWSLTSIEEFIMNIDEPDEKFTGQNLVTEKKARHMFGWWSAKILSIHA